MNTNTTIKALESLTGVAKTYMRISYMKTALSLLFIGYAIVKTIKFFKDR